MTERNCKQCGKPLNELLYPSDDYHYHCIPEALKDLARIVNLYRRNRLVTHRAAMFALAKELEPYVK